MRVYELALVISSKLDNNKIKEVTAKVGSLIKEEKGKVSKEDSWEKRALAYPIGKEKEASYVFLNFETPALSKKFQGKVKLTEGVLRFLLIRKK